MGMPVGGMPSLTDYGAKIKSFWERKEGFTGMIFIALMAGLGIYFWGSVAPFIAAMLRDTVSIVISGGILFVLVSARKTIASIFQSAMRAFTRLWATIDPIGIMEDDLAQDQRDNEKMGQHMETLDGQIEGIKTEIQTAQAEIQTAYQIMKQAKNNLNDPRNKSDKVALQQTMTLSANEAGRQEQYLVTLNNVLRTSADIYEVMSRCRRNLDFLIKDRESFIKIAKKNRKMSITGVSIMQTAKNILHMDPQRVYLLNAAVEAQAEQYQQRMAAIRGFVRESSDFITKGNLRDEMMAQQALRKLEEFERQQGAGENTGVVMNPVLSQQSQQPQSLVKHSEDLQKYFS